MKNLSVRLVLVLFICSQCNSGPSESTIESTIEIHEADKKEAVFSSIFQNVKFVKLETTEQCPITGIMKLSVDKDRIFIFDTFLSTVFVFDINGKFIAAIGKKGKGPGEVNKVNDFALNRKEKWVEILDSGQKKIVVFDYEGHYLHENRSIFAMGFELLNNESHVFYHYNFIFRDNQGGDIKSDVIITDSEGKITNSYEINPVNRNLNLTTFTNIYKTKEGDVYILPVFDYSIYKLSKDRSIKKILNVNFDNQPPEELFKESDGVRSLLEDLKSHKYPCRLHRLIVTDKYYYFVFFEGKEKHQVFIDRRTNDVKILIQDNTKNDLTFINNDYFIGAYDNGLIQSIEAVDFVRIYEELGMNSLNSDAVNSKQNNNLAKTVTIDDNPVLLFFKFN